MPPNSIHAFSAPATRLLRSTAYIGGEWRNASDGRIFEVTNPSDGSLVGLVADCSSQDALAAVTIATATFSEWRRTLPKTRAKLLRKWHDLIIDNIDALAEILASEQGKPLSEANSEILYGASFIEWFSEEARRVYGDVIPDTAAGRDIFVLKEPIGVTAAITPWNFPSAMITRKVAPALAAGCTSIVKPSEEAPLSALALGVLAEAAGIPPGVLNIIPTTRTAGVGQVLTEDPRVRKISFTGSTDVGRLIMRQSAQTIKKLSLELGGNAPFIVFDDANLDLAVCGAIASKYRNSGQTCVCANRFYVQTGIYDAFSERLRDAVAALVVGSAFEKNVQQGPLINEGAIAKVEELLNDAVTKGARVLVGGKRHSRGNLYFEPTVIVDVPRNARLLKEEIFGPVAALVRFETDDEAISLANSSEYGLASYFFSQDIGRAWKIARAIDAGMVGINDGIISTAEAPFGGVKQSGFGREGSKYGINEYLEIKYICMGVA